MTLNESIVEDATLEWFGELGYAEGHGLLHYQTYTLATLHGTPLLKLPSGDLKDKCQTL